MSPISELLALKIENTALKLQQLQATATQLQAEQRQWIEEARAEVSAPVGHVYNTETRQFQAPVGPTPFKAPTARERKRATGAA